MSRIVGRCSRCGSAVTLPIVWFGVIPPTPQCSQCGATAKPTGPVIEMDEPSQPLMPRGGR